MLDHILEKFGYIRKERAWLYVEEPVWDGPVEFTEDELALMLAEKLGVQDNIDEKYEKKIFADLKNTDGLVQYLREAAARDKDRYFGAATPAEQQLIRGAFARTMFLKAKIMGVDTSD